MVLRRVRADRLLVADSPKSCWLCVVAGLLQVSCKRFQREEQKNRRRGSNNGHRDCEVVQREPEVRFYCA